MNGLFADVGWLGVAVGALAAFLIGWYWYSPKGFYPAWSASSGVQHGPGDPMAAAFGSLVVGLILYALFVGVMMARGQCGPLILGIIAFIIMGYSNNAFKKLGGVSRTVDAASWAVSGLVMILAQWLL